MRLSVVASCASALNETARVPIRPSTSGNTTFMVRSRGSSPRVLSRHSASLEPARITCSTGRPGASRTVPRCDAPIAETAKAVAFSTAAGGAASNTERRKSWLSPSLRLATNSGSATIPSSPRAAASISTGAVAPPCRIER